MLRFCHNILKYIFFQGVIFASMLGMEQGRGTAQTQQAYQTSLKITNQIAIILMGTSFVVRLDPYLLTKRFFILWTKKVKSFGVVQILFSESSWNDSLLSFLSLGFPILRFLRAHNQLVLKTLPTSFQTRQSHL